MSSAENTRSLLVASRQPLVAFSLSYLESSPTLAVAVSGGADSLCLLLLADAWAKKRNGRAVALTVDHRMRKESTAEALQVNHWCQQRDIEHHTLTLSEPPENQSDARDARYARLTDWCNQNHVLHLLTAHHQDDQAETFFFRLARGSFLEGLASIPAVSTLDGVRLLRPLLGYPKSALETHLRASGQPWIEDPSNASLKYTRNVIRTHLSHTPDISAKTANLAARVAHIRHQLDHTLASDMVRTVDLFPGYALLKQAPFLEQPENQGLKILQALVQSLGNKPAQPRTEKLQRLYDELSRTNPPRERSLSGCRFRYVRKKHGWQVESEHAPPYMNNTAKPLKPLAGSAFLGLNDV